MTACAEHQADLSALVDDALSPEEALRLEEHLAECPGCKVEGEALAQLAEQVRGLPRRAPPPYFTAAVMAKVVDPRDTQDDMVLLVEEPVVEPAARPASIAPPVPELDPGPAPSATCDLLREDISGYIDDELTPDATRRLEAHLASCVACDAEVWVFDQQRARVRAMPRLQPHDLFVRQIMAKLETEELANADQARRRAEQRAERWKVMGWGLRAAGLLVAAALSLSITGPEDLPEGPLSLPSPRAPAPRPVIDDGLEIGPSIAPPMQGTYEVSLALEAPQGLDVALQTASDRARALRATVVETRSTEVQRELGLHIAANLLDDLYALCDQTAEVDGTPETARLVEELTTEQDRVVLRTGIVLAGQVVAENERAVDILTAGMRQSIRRDRVERIVRATEARRVRIVLRSGDR